MDEHTFSVFVFSKHRGTYTTFYDAFRTFWRHMHRYVRKEKNVENNENYISLNDHRRDELGLVSYFSGIKKFAYSVGLINANGRLGRKTKKEKEEIEHIFLRMYEDGWTISITEDWHPNNLKDPSIILHQSKRAP
ncbi:MAG: hypothetical protein HZA35_02775 [Parcubacteria group bacterium]|nr:hypothetical protein [Parcubacteria group bacterium]